jgi:hypothetical protein
MKGILKKKLKWEWIGKCEKGIFGMKIRRNVRSMEG